MSSKRRKKKNSRTQGSHIKKETRPLQEDSQPFEKEENTEQVEQTPFSTEQEQSVENEKEREEGQEEEDIVKKMEEAGQPEGKSEEEAGEIEETQEQEEPEDTGTGEDNRPPEEAQQEEKEQEQEQERKTPKGKELFQMMARRCREIWHKVQPYIKQCGCFLQKYAGKAWQSFRNIKLCYRMAGLAVAGAALIAVVLAGIFSWEWFGLVLHQRPVAGTWMMEQTEPATYLTLREDGTAIVTTEGLNVKGDYHILENDILSFDVSTESMDVWVGEFHYWATDTGLTLTRVNMEEEQAPDLTMENVLQFEKQETDVTEPTGQAAPVVDEALIGSWSDESQTVTYTFQEDGSLTIDFQGAYYNAVYTAEDGQLDIVTYIPGGESREESNSYTIEENMLTFSNMELFKGEE